MELKSWLYLIWRYDNNAKYLHYFEEWFSNLTEAQIEGFTNQMNKPKEKMLYHENN